MSNKLDTPNPEQDRDELLRQLQSLREYRDWAVHALAKMPQAAPGSGVNLIPIRERLQNAADSANAAAEWLNEEIERMPVPKPLTPGERPHHLRYVNMGLQEAILLFLNSIGQAQSAETIIEEMKAGGAIIGRVRHVGEIKKSLDTNVRSGTLKEIRGKYGHSEWPDEKFK